MSISKEEADTLITRSVFLSQQIKEFTEERVDISDKITEFLQSNSLELYESGDNKAYLYPTLDTPISKLSKINKEKIKNWLWDNHPEALAISFSSLVAYLAKNPDVVLPINLTASKLNTRITNFSKSIPKRLTTVLPTKTKLSQPLETKDETRNEWGWVVSEEKKENAPSKVIQDREKLAIMQAMWDEGETFVAIGKAVGFYPSYVRKKLRPHINKMMRELRKEVKERRAK